MRNILDTDTYWDERYVKGNAIYDTESINPAFENLLKQNDLIKPGKLFVAGCRKGNDAVLAAKYGYEVTAADSSTRAIESAKILAAKNCVNVKFVAKDLFLIEESFTDKFDYVYEFATYNGINPERRKEYLEIISSLLKPGGKLIAILFPMNNKEGEEPFYVSPKDFYKEASGLFKLELSTKTLNSAEPVRGKKIIQIYIKPDKL